ncbi:MAG: hypothetical protein AB7N76_22525 [Planctomycetota bacterium]
MTQDATTLKDLVQQGWTDHERDPAGVLARLACALELVSASDDLPGPVALAVHVAAEHLGRPQDGLALLERYAALPLCDPASAGGQAVTRGQAALLLCAGEAAAAEETIARAHGDSPLPLASTRVRVLAVAASGLAGTGQVEQGAALFSEALELAAYGPGADDPAARALAITGNNLACTLEEKSGRTPAEDALLEAAAQAARRFWEVAGTWSQVQVAEYRLAHTYLALGRAATALTHAEECQRICAEQEATPFDRFFASEAVAKARHATGDTAGAVAAREAARQAAGEVKEGARDYVLAQLAKLEGALE